MADASGAARVFVLVRMLLEALDEQAGGLRPRSSLRSELVALKLDAERVLEQDARRLRVVEGEAEGPEHEVG